MIFFTENDLRKLNEVDVDGQPVDQNDQGGADYTVDDMQPVSPTGNDAGNQDAGSDNPPADDGGDQGNDDGNTDDYTQDDGGDQDAGNDQGGDPEDFTGDDAGGDGSDGGDGDYGDDGGDQGGGDADGGDTGGGGDGSVTADDNRGMEEEIFKDLTKDQIDIKHQELKSNFGKIYDATSSIIDRINEIPSNDNYMASISFISNQLADLRQMVTDYMNNVYSTKSYMENSINYNKFLITLKGINDILEEIYKNIDKNSDK